MPAASFLPRTAALAGATLINISADVQAADGSTQTVRIQGEDLLAFVMAKAGGNGLPALDSGGALILSGASTWNTNGDGHLVVPLAAVPETSNGFVPVAGSNVVYTDGGIFKRAI